MTDDRDLRDLLEQIEQRLAEADRLFDIIEAGGLRADTVRQRVTQVADQCDAIRSLIDRARVDGLVSKPLGPRPQPVNHVEKN